MSDLNTSELLRYSRHLNMSEWSRDTQIKLKSAKVLVIGAGGLGSPVLLYLAAAGVGTIGIVEFDDIDISNLQRQVLYSDDQIGQSKLSMAAQRIRQINPHIQVNEIYGPLTADNALEILAPYDVVVDGTDNFPTRYLVNDACVLSDKVNVYASVLKFEGQVSVFNYLNTDGTRGPNYRDLFPTPPPDGLVPNCAEAGVLGVLPGIIGSMQALEAIKVITGIGEALVGRLWIFDGLTNTSRILKFKKQENYQINELIDYDAFCGINNDTHLQISVDKLKEKLNSTESIKVIDVREQHEYNYQNIGAESIPLSTIREHTPTLSNNHTYVIHCQSGQRSLKAIELLKIKNPDVQFLNMKGGIKDWLLKYPELNLSD